MKKSISFKLFCFVVVAAVGSQAFGLCFSDTGDHDWHNSANWDTGAVPAHGDSPYIVSNGSTAVISQNVDAAEVFVGSWTVGQGTLTVINNAYVLSWYETEIGSYGAGADGTLIIESGTWETANNTDIGDDAQGTLLVNGGLFTNINWNINIGSNGHIQVNSGSVHAGNNFVIAVGGSIDIAGGDLRLTGDRTGGDPLLEYLADGTVTSYGQAGIEQFSITYDAGSNQTIIGSIPEPTTIVLLSLGGFALLRRKK
jgi:hypothetical protein